MRLAVLIDAENAQHRLVASVLEHMDEHGTASLRRAYGDWSMPTLAGWRTVVETHAIEAMHQFRSGSGKNSSDCVMIVDAMDLLYSGRFDGFCLMSNDNDFASLARRIRREGCRVFGFGSKGAGEQLQAACDRYRILEDAPHPSTAPGTAEPDAAMTMARHIAILSAAVEASREGSGWSPLCKVGLRLKQEGLTPKALGHATLRKLLTAFDFFEVAPAGSGAGIAAGNFVRRKGVPA